jgi:hypothetical protein
MPIYCASIRSMVSMRQNGFISITQQVRHCICASNRVFLAFEGGGQRREVEKNALCPKVPINVLKKWIALLVGIIAS